MRASFDSRAPMKPTGQPTIAAGRGPPATIISSRWNSAVGALPIATTAPRSCGPQRETAAAVRVVRQLARQLRDPGREEAVHRVAGRQPAGGDAHATIRASQKIGRRPRAPRGRRRRAGGGPPGRRPGRSGRCRGSSGRRPSRRPPGAGQVRLRPDGGEGVGVDGGPVGDVRKAPRRGSQCPRSSQTRSPVPRRDHRLGRPGQPRRRRWLDRCRRRSTATCVRTGMSRHRAVGQ